MAQIKHTIDYASLLERAALGVVTDVLRRVQQEGGLPGRHYFYITFETTYPGVILAESLRQQYPQMMTIVLQRQFWDLEVQDDLFAVTLSFDRQPQRLHIPFASLLRFSDPSVDFNLRFRALTSERQQLRDRDETGASPGTGSPGTGSPGTGLPGAGSLGTGRAKGDRDVVKFLRTVRSDGSRSDGLRSDGLRPDGLRSSGTRTHKTDSTPHIASMMSSRSLSHADANDPEISPDAGSPDGGSKILKLDDFRTQWSGSTPLTSHGKPAPDSSTNAAAPQTLNEDKDDDADDHP